MISSLIRTPLGVAALAALAIPAAHAQDDIRTEPVHFKAGASSATVKGKIKGYETVDYVLEAGNGQHMTVGLSTDNASSYFNILAPGENETAMFVGSTSGNQFKGALPKAGAYKIRVYLMRNAARRNEVANYSLTMSITGAAAKAAAPAAKPKGHGASVSDLTGTDAIAAIDAMSARGFKSVDTITSGETLYGIYYNPSTKQCIQLTNADDKVYAVNDIKTHPKCH
ncbi:hypothetical protein [Methyloceanibacter methanicus]|uniref:hypothetical protein n=1 Tax=Methyloceanibacter methanicus TaxID=1774968 RepID=UPI000849DD65|nr:hypothetical protein [Methyloceanibacter methanicus]